MKKSLISLALAALILLAPMNTGFADIKNLGRDNIRITGPITEESFEQFLEATAFEANRDYRIFIHTNGGDAYSTIAIMNRIDELKARGCTFQMEVYGKAFSAGAYIFMMGDKRIVHEGSHLMFHTMMQQAPKAAVANGRKMSRNAAVRFSMIEQMDNYIEKRFRKIVGDRMSESAIQYWLRGTKEEDTKAQWMSARTAYNVGIATDIVEH